MTKAELEPQADALADMIQLKVMDVMSLDKTTGDLYIVRDHNLNELCEIRAMVEEWEHYPMFAVDFEPLIEWVSGEQFKLRQVVS